MKGVFAKYGRIGHYAEVALLLFLAWQYLSLWRTPALDATPEIQAMIGIVTFELFVLQSGLVVSVLPRWAAILYLLFFIGGYALLFAQWIPSQRIAVIYLFLLINRGAYIFSDQQQGHTQGLRWYTGIAYTFFILLLALTALFAGSIPTLGLDASFLKLSGYWESGMADRGLLFAKPHLGMFLGTTVYFGLSLLEWSRARRMGPFKWIEST